MGMPETFGTYELLERIAVGGMAEIFVARSRDPRMKNRPVVVKRMLPQIAESPEHVTMFLDEGKLGAVLKHPCIVEVLDIGNVANGWFMALEYVDGPDLGQVLRTARDANQPLPNVLSAYIIARAAEGLHFAHNVTDPKSGQPLALIHRDVSPQNILVGRDGGVKVADFGVAKSGQQHHETGSGLVKGKIAYMSPEQISAQEIDIRTDVLALGVSLWEALTHRRLYGGLSDVEIMKRVYFENPPAPSTVNPDVDKELEAILMRCVARRRKDRWSSAGELMNALDRWGLAQPCPPSKEALASWMVARFVPRATIAEAATGWAYKSPSESTSFSDGVVKSKSVEFPDDTVVDGADTFVDDAPVNVDAEAATKKRPALKPIMKIRPLSSPPRELVLYVEDEMQNWEVAALRLKRNYELLHAPDDQMACEILRGRGRDLSAILMDIQLKGSELDGIALVKLIRGTLGTQVPSYARGVPTLTIPIFFVTAYAARYSESELLAHGGDKLVTKPVDFAQLTLALTSYHLRRAARMTPLD